MRLYGSIFVSLSELISEYICIMLIFSITDSDTVLQMKISAKKLSPPMFSSLHYFVYMEGK